MKSRYRAILFDSGNTLIFPNVGDLVADLNAEGYRITLQDFHAADRAGKEKLDSWLLPRLTSSNPLARPEMVYWVEYMRVLGERLDAPWTVRGRFVYRVVKTLRSLPFWSHVEPFTGSFLEGLRTQGFRLGVISNATGKMREQLVQLNLAKHFDFILDSSVVGVEKPSPAIFRMGLDAAGVSPSEALFVGDTYSIDIAGARQAGVRGVLIDTTGAYTHRHGSLGCDRITSLIELTRVLESPADSIAGAALEPREANRRFETALA